MDKVKKYGKIAIIVLAVLALIGLAVVVLVLYGWFGVLLPFYNVPNDNKAVVEYDPSSALVSQATYDALINSNKSDKFELGINKDGEVVFVHAYKAFGRAKKEYKDVWKYADKKLGLKHLSRTYYINYMDDDILAQVVEAEKCTAGDAKIYKEILEIYSHSYNKHR